MSHRSSAQSRSCHGVSVGGAFVNLPGEQGEPCSASQRGRSPAQLVSTLARCKPGTHFSASPVTSA
jgi:hypothetical protein